jgi:hypothetical protein
VSIECVISFLSRYNIERVLNSEENLPLDAQMQITIGSIAIPRGSGTLAITRLTGPQNSIAIKMSLMKISFQLPGFLQKFLLRSL